MSKFSIKIDVTSSRFLRQVQAKDNILCNFHIRIDGWSFPSSDWLDFPIVVLGWWLESYLTLLKTGELVQNTFMNGPFEFVVVKREKNVILTFQKRTSTGNQEIGNSVDLTLEEYKKGLVQAADNLLYILDIHLSKSQDIDNLKAFFNAVIKNED